MIGGNQLGQRPAWGALVVALIPFVVTFRSRTTVNGVVTSSTDFVAIILGAVAIVWGGSSLLGVWATRTPPLGVNHVVPLGVPIAAILIGLLQVLRGIGVVTAF